jgi:cell division protein FtsB
MADERRSTRGRSAARGRSGPGRGAAARPAKQQKIERRQAHRERISELADARAEEKRRSRLTGRAAILVLVLAVLAVSFASSLRAYLQQRSHIDELRTTIAQREAAIKDLQVEKDRWQDPAYVEQQARELGYVQVGDTPFIVLGKDGQPLGSSADLDDPTSVGSTDQRTWIDDLWASDRVAGNPPTKIPPPPSRHLKDQ